MSKKELKQTKVADQVMVGKMEEKETTVKQLNPELEHSPAPTHFSISLEGINELAEALNDTVKSIHVRNVIFNIMNTHLKPL